MAMVACALLVSAHAGGAQAAKAKKAAQKTQTQSKSGGGGSCIAGGALRTVVHTGNHETRTDYEADCPGVPADHKTSDRICEDLSQRCPAAGSFSKFLWGVTSQCADKGFAKLHGLDGLTFGILDFTYDNLPSVFTYFRRADAARLRQIMANAPSPFREGNTPSDRELCQMNRNNTLICGTDGQYFRNALISAIHDPVLQKAQLRKALDTFQAHMGASGSTVFRRVANATLGNNPRRAPECLNLQSGCPSEEAAQTLCMLRNFAKNRCRGHGGSDEAVGRCASVLSQFGVSDARGVCSGTRQQAVTAQMREPFRAPGSFESIVACSSLWGRLP
jgi:hypothetical protein